MKDSTNIQDYFKDHHWIIKRLNELRGLIYKEVKNLGVGINKDSSDVSINDADNLFYRPIYEGEIWGEDGQKAWFHVTSKLPKGIQHEHVVLIINVGAEGIVYKDNQPISSVAPTIEYIDRFNASPSNEEIELTKCSQGGELINLYIEATFNEIIDKSLVKRAKFEYAKICVVNDLYKKFYYDYFSLCCLYPTIKDRRQQEELKDILDISYHYAIDKQIENAINSIYGLIKSFGDNSFDICACGFSPIDIGGDCSFEETNKKVHRTLIEQYNNITKHEGFKFSIAQPYELEIINNNDHQLIEKYIQCYKEKKFEPQGVFYTEPNLMVANGESIIRNIYFGKKTLKDLFGYDSNIAILQNAYKLPANICQLFVKSGVKYVLTSDLTQNSFPYSSFVLKGMDGSEILVHDLVDNKSCGEGTPIESEFIKNNLKDNNISKTGLMLYGTKNGVTGPNEIHIETIERQAYLSNSPIVEQKFVSEFFNELFNFYNVLPYYENRVSVNYNQASYTYQSFIKSANRQCEKLLKQLEYLDAYNFVINHSTMEDKLRDLWKEVLFLQSNKILSGYSNSDINKEVLGRYSTIIKEITDLKESLMTELLGEGETYFTFNPSSLYQHGRMPNGSPYDLMPFEIKEREPFKYPHFYAYDQNSIANGITTIKFNKYGQITSLVYDGKEYIDKKSNVIRMYNDKYPKNDFKEFDTRYTKRRSTILKASKSSITFHRNKISKTFFYKNNDVEITQMISLYDGKPGAEFKTSIKEKTTDKMIRVDFSPSIFNDTCICKSHFCETKHPTNIHDKHPDIELCCQGYSYVYDELKEMGFCLLSDKKYGYRVSDKTISLDLVKTNKNRNENNPDLKQPFKYQIFPMDNFNKNEILETYSSMAYPIETFKGQHGLESLIISTNKEAVITCVKKSYDKNAVICRVYENNGFEISTALKVNFKYKEVYECNLIEEIDNSVSENLNLDDIRLNPYEIRTFIFIIN